MNEVDGFMSTWKNARQTYGEGTPQEGSAYDASATLTRVSETVTSAAPGGSWTGEAATTYDTANTTHAQTFTKFADLDRRLGASINASANIVSTGRQNLDSIRQWVADAAANTDDSQAGEQIRRQIVSRGLSDLIAEIQRTDGNLSDVGRQIQLLGDEYRTLGDDQVSQFGPEGTEDGQGEGDEEDGEPTEQEIQDQAQRDVDSTLNRGDDPAAITRVENTLNSIQPGQPLTTEQSAYLSQMQIQQKGMSLESLKAAEDRLGERGHVIGDSWQLMSDTDVQLKGEEIPPETLNDPVAKAQYYENKLPDSVLHALNREGLDSWNPLHDPVEARTSNAHDVSTIADIVRDGQDRFQQGTALDDAMLDWSRETMADPTNGGGLLSPFGLDGYNEYADARDDALADVFNTAGVDHQAVSAELGGPTGQEFLTELHTHVWAETDDMTENQASTHSLLSWIGDEAHSPNEWEATRAGVAAHALAVNLDDNHAKYVHPDGTPFGPSPNVANTNPSLIAADAIALEPYQDALVGDYSDVKGFEPIGNPADGDLEHARNIFSVIDSDPGAAEMFNAAAEEKILAHQQAFADATNRGPAIADTPSGDLQRAAYLLGAVNGGAEMEATARGLQGAELDKAIYDVKKAGLDYAFGKVPGLDKIPGIDMPRDFIEQGILGSSPSAGQAPSNVETYSPQHAINATYYQVAEHFDIRPGDIDPKFFDGETLRPPGDLNKTELGEYQTALNNYLTARGYSHISTNFDQWYEDAAGK